jgi:Ni/Fe-hydrogenase subunit HybB-like protein
MGVLAYRGAMRILHRREDRTVVHGLCRLVVGFSIVYLAAKLAEVWWAGEAALLWSAPVAWLWWAELGIGVVLPVVLWAIPALRRISLVQWLVPILVLAGVLMNRFDATLYAQVVRSGATYTPHVLEWISTAGILAAALLAWIIGIRFFSGEHSHEPHH